MSDFVYNTSGVPIYVPGLHSSAPSDDFLADLIYDTNPQVAYGTSRYDLSIPSLPGTIIDDGPFLFNDDMFGLPAKVPANDNHNCRGQAADKAASSSAPAPVVASDNDSDNDSVSDASNMAPRTPSPRQLPHTARTGAKSPVGVALIGYANIRQILASSLSPQAKLNSIASIAYLPSYGATADEIDEYNEDAVSSDDNDDDDNDDEDYNDDEVPSSDPPTTFKTGGKGYRNSTGGFSGTRLPSSSPTTPSSFITPAITNSITPGSPETPPTSPLTPSADAFSLEPSACSLAPCENTRSRGARTGTSTTISTTFIPAANTATPPTSGKTAPTTATTPKKKAIQMRWTDEEHDLVRSTLRKIAKDGGASTERRFELVADALNAKFLSRYQTQYGPEAKRTKWSVKNQVTRVTRAMDKEEGIDFDDRKARKDGKDRPVVTSVRPNKKRSFDDVSDEDEGGDEVSPNPAPVARSSPPKRQRVASSSSILDTRAGVAGHS